MLHVSKNVSGYKLLLYGNGSEISKDMPICIDRTGKNVQLRADLIYFHVQIQCIAANCKSNKNADPHEWEYTFLQYEQ